PYGADYGDFSFIGVLVANHVEPWRRVLLNGPEDFFQELRLPVGEQQDRGFIAHCGSTASDSRYQSMVSRSASCKVVFGCQPRVLAILLQSSDCCPISPKILFCITTFEVLSGMTAW